MTEISIQQLDQGFLVRRGSNPVAALTTGRDLCDWIAVWSNAEVDIREPEEPAEEVGIKVIPGEVLEDAYPEKSAQRSQENDPEPETVEVPEKPKRASGKSPAARNQPTADLTENQLAVLQHIEKCAKPGQRFQIGMKELASRSGVTKGGIPFFLGKLKEAGLIDYEPPYGGDVFITRMRAGQVAA